MPAGTPIIIDHLVYPHAIEPQNQAFGPWEYNGDVWIVVSEEPRGSSSFLRVYHKALNAADNVPWVEADSGDHPEVDRYTAGIWFDGAFYIYCIYTNSGVTTFRKFNLATEEWETPFTSFSDVVPKSGLHLRPDGSDWIIYLRIPDTVTTLGRAYWRKYDGAWSTPVLVSDNIADTTDVVALQVTTDDDGIFHLAWRRISGLGNFITYSRILNAGSLGSISEMTPAITAIFPGPGVEWDNKVAIAYGYQDNSVFPPVGRIKIAYGEPTGNPTWTQEDIATDDRVTGIWTIIGDDGDLFVWWITNFHVAYSHKSLEGSWSATQEWYAWEGLNFYESDGVTLTPWPSTNFFHNGSIVQIDGSWEMIVGGYIDDISTVFYVPGHGVATMNVYTDEAQDLTVMAE